MVDCFVDLEPVLFSVQQLNVQSTNVTLGLLINLDLLSLLPNLGEFIHYDGCKDLLHDDCKYKQSQHAENHVPDGLVRIHCLDVLVVTPHNTTVLLEGDV